MKIFTSVLSLFILLCHSTALAAPVGICYGLVANNLPPPPVVVNLIQTNKIPTVRLFNTDPSTLSAFLGTNISLMIGIPNEALPSLASNDLNFNIQYLETNIFSFIDRGQVRYISVGNEIFLRDTFYSLSLIPAIKNLYQAIVVLGLDEKVKISSPLAASILSNSYPPSAGAFDYLFRDEMIQLLEFLRATDSPLMVNVYPFFSYTSNPEYVSIDYALYRHTPVQHDQNFVYDNMFDATVDAFVYAMEREGFFGIPVVVAETGWPTSGGVAASIENAAAYNTNVTRRTLNNIGTPKRPGVGVEVFLFDLYDENEKQGEEYERHFGIFGFDGVKGYDIVFN